MDVLAALQVLNQKPVLPSLLRLLHCTRYMHCDNGGRHVAPEKPACSSSVMHATRGVRCYGSALQHAAYVAALLYLLMVRYRPEVTDVNKALRELCDNRSSVQFHCFPGA